MREAQFNVLTATAVDLQQLLQDRTVTSAQLVNEYVAQINQHEPTLNALIAVAPREVLVRTAESLDEERLSGHIRSPLHGIPIVLKVILP
jgi:amidase